MSNKKADLAGPGISTYEEVAKILPKDYKPMLDRMDTQGRCSRSSATSRTICARR